MKAALFPIVACLLFISLINARAEGNLWSGRIDLSEDANSYTVRVQARNASALEVRLVGNTLSIASGDLSSGARHTQRIDLPLAESNSTPQTSIVSDELTVTITKRPPGSPASPSAPNLADVTDVARQLLNASGLLGGQGQDSAEAVRGKVIDQMAALSRQMDQLADDPAGGGDLFGAMMSRFASTPNSTPSFELQELPDRYVLSAPVPREQVKNISVNVDNERFVTITIRNESTTTAPGVTGAQASTSTRAMTLPGPAHADRLAMDYKDGNFVITLPKK